MKFQFLFLALTISLASAANVQPEDSPSIMEGDHAAHLKGWTDPSIQTHCDIPFDTPLETCAAEQTSAFSPEDEIAIVGAGVSGLTMAYLLKKKGFNNVHLLEKKAYPGGYAQTVYYGDSSIPHERGTCYTLGRYECLLQMANEFFVTPVRFPKDKSEARYGDSQSLGNVNSFWFWYLNNNLGFKLTSLQEFAGVVLAALGKYRGLYFEIMGDGEYLFPATRPTPEKMALLNVTMLELLTDNDCTALIPYLYVGQTYQGYGFLDSIPALYGLMWFSPSMVDQVRANVMQQATPPGISASMLKEGYGGLMRRVAKGMNISFNVDITQIRRDDDKVYIDYTDEQNAENRASYDHLIVTTRMPATLDMFANVYPEEKALFEKLQARELTMAHVAMNFSNKIPIMYQFEGADTWEPNKVSMIRNDQKMLFYDLEYNPDEPDIRAVLTETDPSTSNVDLEAILTQHLADEGVESSEFLSMDRYEYHSAFTTEEIALGLPWDLRDLQGKYRTWYAGSYASFESVADVMDYNMQLIQTELCNTNTVVDLDEELESCIESCEMGTGGTAENMAASLTEIHSSVIVLLATVSLILW